MLQPWPSWWGSHSLQGSGPLTQALNFLFCWQPHAQAQHDHQVCICDTSRTQTNLSRQFSFSSDSFHPFLTKPHMRITPFKFPLKVPALVPLSDAPCSKNRALRNFWGSFCPRGPQTVSPLWSFFPFFSDRHCAAKLPRGRRLLSPLLSTCVSWGLPCSHAPSRSLVWSWGPCRGPWGSWFFFSHERSFSEGSCI